VLDRSELARLLDVPGKESVWKRLHAGKVHRDRLLLALFSYGGCVARSCSVSMSTMLISTGA
jgi:hypothetical protein